MPNVLSVTSPKADLLMQFELLIDAFRFGLERRMVSPWASNLLDHFYGPAHAGLRADMASMILERKCVKSGKESQWGNWHNLIVTVSGAIGNCVAEREQNAAKVIWNELLGERTGSNGKSWNDHYEEFKGYCQTLTDSQLENVIGLERDRVKGNPSDLCYDACYKAARDEEKRRLVNGV